MRAPFTTPIIRGPNIQDWYSVFPAKVAAQVNNRSYAPTEECEDVPPHAWKTSGVDILSDDPGSSMSPSAPISLHALSSGLTPAQGGDIVHEKENNALAKSHELARTTCVPVARNHLAQGRVDAPTCPHDVLKQTDAFIASPSIIPTVVEGSSDGSHFTCGYERHVSGLTDIPVGPMVSTGDSSPHAIDTTGNDAHLTVRLRGLPAEDFEGSVLKLKGRLLRKGAEPAAVDICIGIFSEEISIAALEKSMTREESEEHGVVGKRYRMLLEKRTESGAIKNRCRLCGEVEYKNHRDALRHLLKGHFGMGYKCTYNWYV
jgi:hypothetical protein